MVKNGGTDYRPKGDPWRVGKVVPYGVYDMTTNAGFVSVGITSDTAEFVVRSIHCWREHMGRRAVRMRGSSPSRRTAAARMARGCGFSNAWGARRRGR